jgi:hypothetical protein
MSSLQAALLVAVLVVPVAALIVWRTFFREDGNPVDTVPAEPINRLSASDVQSIETALGVTLPADYARFLQEERPEAIDCTTVRDDAELIIGFTQDYRGDSDWPVHLVWIGDEADGCPYTLDCLSGEVFRLQKGNLLKAWDRHPGFAEFVAEKLRQRKQWNQQ